MRKRRRLVIAVLLVGAVATFILPPVYWRVAGWVKGEAFYDGRPTSWWEGEIRTHYSSAGSVIFVPSNNGEVQIVEMQKGWVRVASPSWYEFLLPARFQRTVEERNPPLTDGNIKALPVVQELLRSDDAKVRRVAAWGLGELRQEAMLALPAIQEACGDADGEVQSAAWRARRQIEDEQFP